MNPLYRDELRAALLGSAPQFRLSEDGRSVVDDTGTVIARTECLTVEEVLIQIATAAWRREQRSIRMNIRPDQVDIREHVNLQTDEVEYMASVHFAVIVTVPREELYFVQDDAIGIAALATRAQDQAVQALIDGPEQYLTRIGEVVKRVAFVPNQFKPKP